MLCKNNFEPCFLTDLPFLSASCPSQYNPTHSSTLLNPLKLALPRSVLLQVLTKHRCSGQQPQSLKNVYHSKLKLWHHYRRPGLWGDQLLSFISHENQQQELTCLSSPKHPPTIRARWRDLSELTMKDPLITIAKDTSLFFFLSTYT